MVNFVCLILILLATSLRLFIIAKEKYIQDLARAALTNEHTVETHVESTSTFVPTFAPCQS